MDSFTHFREKCHRMPFGRKCVRGQEEDCALERPGRLGRGWTALRTSTESATEGRLGGSALEGRRRNLTWRGLEGRFDGGRRYALPRKVQQKAVLAEVRWEGYIGQRNNGAERLVQCRMGCPKGSPEYIWGHYCSLRCPKGRPRVHFGRFLFAQVPQRLVGWRSGRRKSARTCRRSAESARTCKEERREVPAGYPAGPDSRLSGLRG